MSDDLRTDGVFERLNAPIFLARATRTAGEPLLTLHTTERRGLAKIAAKATSALAREGIKAQCSVVSHNAHRLRRARSLESLSRRFGSGDILYDPTNVVARSAAVVACARRIRAELGAAVQNISLDANRRTLYVIVRDTGEHDEQTALRADLVRRVGQILRQGQASAPGFALAARIGYSLPRDAQLVSVDDRSIKRGFYSPVFERKQFMRGAVAMGFAALFGASLAVPAAAGEPAVSTPNLQFMGRFGESNDDFASDFGVKGAMALGEQFGVQAEAGVGGKDYLGIGGHVFWRDPAWAMVGVFASQETNDGIDMTRWGVEADFYIDRFTLGGRVGGQSGDVEDGTFGRVDVSFYATPDVVLRAGGEFTPDEDLGRAGIEWRPAFDGLPQLSIFADGEWGDHDHDSIMAGFRLHFGAPGATLIDRDRREDPWWLIWNRTAMVEKHHGYGPVVAPSSAQ